MGDRRRHLGARGVREQLDRAFVRSWIVDMMGEDDERVRRWDSIVHRFAAGASWAASTWA